MSTDTYYDRSTTQHLDGTPVFATQQDRDNEAVTARALAQAWSCELHSWGELAPLDWYATRHGRLVGVLELKSRTHPTTQYPTVFLNVRKWLALNLAAIGLDVPALFVVRFTDEVRWMRVGVTAGTVRIAGCNRQVKSRSDVEPVIEVPVSDMRTLA